ncbi:anti-phage defense ZorAB system protein ZorA [Paucibacter sp. B2R-40]|uniref:anti-phage ZorAB system protein ZorA n=1 Tax=Paucibacter sp. B2R-40 TaxID=2893554 RepID=UPI0021E4D5D5|nr:anti-phage ZorAB system protein ZorA [Paucibacter sp. B2R-40]MCV2355377.1 anti-phage defense ZorAB system protein ZorA [Paucibacter sp. B2R-40]
MIDVSAVPFHLLVTGGLLALLVLSFIVLFLLPGIRHWFRLRAVLSSVLALAGKSPPAELKKVFVNDLRLAHLWSEYQDTLHVQREEHEGQMLVTAVRSTVPAEAFFNNQFVVDSRLRTEFFKHLPGIFTGLGIIGTFTGLISGLANFKVSDNAATVRESLESLMHSVGEAFLISAAAITAAMAVTFFEKFLLAALYRKSEEIAHAIDARFDGGAGEEYLSRLVTASEASASQTKILKDALVKELGDILRELTASQLATGERMNLQLAQRIEDSSNKQVSAAREDNQALGDAIAESIERSLKGPLEDIASTVKSASGDQSSSAIQMLNDVMVSFSQRLNDLFGGQINGINELNKQTAQGMQDAVASLSALVGKLEDSGSRATNEMASQMAASIKAMEERQGSMNEQSQAFVEQIRKLVESSQAETQQKLQSTLETIGQQMTTILTTLGETQTRAFESNRAREESMADRAQGMVSGMTGSVESAVKEMTAASQSMTQSVSVLAAATTTSVDKLSAGAERLNSAATNFATAGEKVSGVMGQAATVSAKLNEVSGALTVSAGAVQEALSDYRSQREAVSQLLAGVRATVELARKEASLTADVLQRIEASTAKLGTAQKAADDYLDGVSTVLANSSEAFRESVVSTLSKVNHDFHTKLSGAVGLLSTAVQELEVTLGSLAPRR